MKGIKHCLWFDSEAEEAARFYASVFKDGKVGRINRYLGVGTEIHGQPKGKVMTVEFSIAGQNYLALNGGPLFKFNEAFSIVVNCETQEEIDYYTEALTAGGGQIVECGWIRDRYGLSWQISPVILEEMMFDPDPEKVSRVVEAFLKMKKFDIEGLKRAYAGK